MENNLDIIENIMKPYFDKKEEIDKTKSDANANLNSLKLKLEKLKDNKENEIQQYIDEAMSSRSNFYSEYGAMIRKDLELAYKEKEDSLRIEIDLLERSSNFDRVDIKEIIEIKDEIRKQLIKEQKRLNFELMQQQINFDSVMLELSAFKYEYNDQQQVINGDAWRELYEKSNKISNEISQIKEALNKIDEYLKLSQLTKEEISIAMMSLTPWEQEEYNRRKEFAPTNNELEEIEISPVTEDFEEEDLVVIGDDGAVIPSITEDEMFEEEPFTIVEETIADEPTINDDMVIEDDQIVSNYEYEDGNMGVDTADDLLTAIYNDIMNEISNLRSVRLNSSKENLSDSEYYVSTKENNNQQYNQSGIIDLGETDSIELPTGEYLNEEDFNQALKNYYDKDKGKSFIVRETKKEYKITKDTIRKFKKQLKKCSALKLVKDEKLSIHDVYTVFGKNRNQKEFNKNKLGDIHSGIENFSGDYINRDEVIAKLGNVFTTKKLSWLKNISSKLKLRNKVEEEIPVYDVEYLEEKVR